MERSQKQEAVASMKEMFASSGTVVVTHYRGMSVGEMTELRKKARENDAFIRVTKNTLAKLAANDTQFDGMSDMFQGPTAVAYSQDAVAAAKAVVEFAKENEKLVIIGGSIDGALLDVLGIESLAATPSLDSSRGKIVGLLNAPASRIATVLSAPGSQVARVISAHASQGA